TEGGGSNVVAAGRPSTTFLIEPGERAFQPDPRLSRRGGSARRIKRLQGLQPLRKAALFQDPVEEQSGQRAQESGDRRDRRSSRNDIRAFFPATRHMLHYLGRRPCSPPARRRPRRR